MPIDPTRREWFNSEVPEGPAQRWYTLSNANIGAAELPLYGRALILSVGAAVALPVSIVVVPVGEPSDSATRTITITQAGSEVVIPRGVRRIVSINGGATIPAGLQIDVVTA